MAWRLGRAKNVQFVLYVSIVRMFDATSQVVAEPVFYTRKR
jgi:hypothetical protein